jgi:hypothetical protein
VFGQQLHGGIHEGEHGDGNQHRVDAAQVFVTRRQGSSLTEEPDAGKDVIMATAKAKTGGGPSPTL